jgi:two-component system response regulator AtoC
VHAAHRAVGAAIRGLRESRTPAPAAGRACVNRASRAPRAGPGRRGRIAGVDRAAPSSADRAGLDALELAVVVGDTLQIAPLPPHGPVTLGRGPDCDVCIDNRSVSRRHAVLHLGPGLRIQDLGSANGTFVRDARSPLDTVSTQPLRKLSRETLEISVGERVNLGSISIVVRRAAAGRDPTASEAGPVVRDPAMRALYEQVTRAARSAISVLVLGETGVGKEVLARAIHERSPRAGGPFLELSCAALPASLLEAELFGHEKHAFTGAGQARAGLLEATDRGTIFLDEIGELPAAIQVKLLRVLEDRKVTRVGGRTPRQLDIRFVAATNRDLEAEVAARSFREDLYFRLNGVSFTVPPLRARISEIAPLAERFLAAAGRMLDRTEPLRLSPDALGYLERHPWPGNVRELRNLMERAAVLASGDVIVPADLPGHITHIGSPRSPTSPSPTVPGMIQPATPGDTRCVTEPASASASPLSAEAAEDRERIVRTLEQCAGNQTRAAKLLGISLRTLVNRLGAYGLARPRKPT